jgi:hypothetical protein
LQQGQGQTLPRYLRVVLQSEDGTAIAFSYNTLVDGPLKPTLLPITADGPLKGGVDYRIRITDAYGSDVAGLGLTAAPIVKTGHFVTPALGDAWWHDGIPGGTTYQVTFDIVSTTVATAPTLQSASLSVADTGSSLPVADTSTLTARVATTAPVAPAAPQISTRTLLSQLAVRRETPWGFKSTRFGGWLDRDRDGCRTPTEVMLSEARVAPPTGHCALTGGQWYSPLDGLTTSNLAALRVTDLVPLAEVWQSGARNWSPAKRQNFLNDLGYGPTLMSVSARVTTSRGSKEPQSWMPPRRAAGCSYVAQWVAVKWRWHLAVNTTEKRYLSSKLAACGWPPIAAPHRAG